VFEVGFLLLFWFGALEARRLVGKKLKKHFSILNRFESCKGSKFAEWLADLIGRPVGQQKNEIFDCNEIVTILSLAF